MHSWLQISVGSVVKQCWASPALGWVTIQGKAGALGVMVVVALGFQVCHYHHAGSPLSSTPKIQEALRHRTQTVCSIGISHWVSRVALKIAILLVGISLIKQNVQPYICYHRGCGLELAMFVFLVLPILYPNDTLTGFLKTTKTCQAVHARHVVQPL